MILTVPQRHSEWPRRVRARAGRGAAWLAAAAVVAAVVVAVLLPILTIPLQATVVVPADFAELAVEAAAIVHGRVVRVEARQGEGRRVERLVTLQAFEYFKNAAAWGNVVQFRLAGGTLGRYRTVMIGAPELAEGDEVVLFLGVPGGTGAAGAPGASASTEGRPFILGLHQGLFRVVADEASGRRMVMPPIVQGVPAGTTAPSPTRRGDINRQPLELREFQGRIAAALASPRIARAGDRPARGAGDGARPTGAPPAHVSAGAASARSAVAAVSGAGGSAPASAPAAGGATAGRVVQAGPR